MEALFIILSAVLCIILVCMVMDICACIKRKREENIKRFEDAKFEVWKKVFYGNDENYLKTLREAIVCAKEAAWYLSMMDIENDKDQKARYRELRKKNMDLYYANSPEILWHRYIQAHKGVIYQK